MIRRPILLFLKHVLSTEQCYPHGRGSSPHYTSFSTITYFVLSRATFNVAKLLIHYFGSFSVIRDPNFLRKPNLALGHLIAFILEVKYNISYSVALDHTLTLFTNYTFHIFYDSRRHPA